MSPGILAERSEPGGTVTAMCGRYASIRSAADLAALFDAIDDTDGPLEVNYNVAPTDPVPVVRRARDGSRRIAIARWGLLPHWAKHPREGARMINARAETVATTPAYRDAFARRRCLVPADGWYEWLRRADSGGKQPYFMTRPDGAGLAFAGLWQPWGPERMLTCTIVTTAALGELDAVHDRMPLVLAPDRWSQWLGDGPVGEPRAGESGGEESRAGESRAGGSRAGGSRAGESGPAAARESEPLSAIDALLAAPSEAVLAGLEIRPVGRQVGDVRNNSPELIQAVAAAPLHAPPIEPVDLTLF